MAEQDTMTREQDQDTVFPAEHCSLLVKDGCLYVKIGDHEGMTIAHVLAEHAIEVEGSRLINNHRAHRKALEERVRQLSSDLDGSMRIAKEHGDALRTIRSMLEDSGLLTGTRSVTSAIAGLIACNES